MKARNLFLLVVALAAAVALAAPPLASQARRAYAIQGATIHTVAGDPIENGTVVIRDGKIVAVGANVQVPSGAEVISARGMHVWPGMFDSVSRLGMTEIGQVSATVDLSELGDWNPHIIAAWAIHPPSEHIPVARANGVTHAVSAPTGGVFSGRASAIHLDGWTVEEMLINPSVGLIMNWPTMSTTSFDFATFSVRRRPFAEVKREYDRRLAEITDWFGRARHYAQAMERGSPANFTRDLKLESLVPVVRGELPLLVTANGAREIRAAVEFCEKEKMKLVILSGAEAWKVKDLLKEKNIPVILRSTQSLPGNEDEPYDKPYSNPGELHAAGVKFAIATFNSSDSRTLPFEAGMAVPYGLPHDAAVAAITRNPAEILGLGDRLGTIEAGKIANLVVTTGDILEIRNEVKHVFIQGRPVSLANRHQQLYELYRSRPARR
jgi:imidazolonepropionase-like amidohydrolase